MFKVCPVCASPRVLFDRPRWRCPDCGMVYFHNTACACAALIECEGKLLVLSRAQDPGRGLLDLPGGFVDPGEGVLEALKRECYEELGCDIGAWEASFLGSWPNVYPYKGFVYNTCDMFFTLRSKGFSIAAARLEASEVREARLVFPSDIPDEAVAFDSARRAIRAYQALYDNRH